MEKWSTHGFHLETTTWISPSRFPYYSDGPKDRISVWKIWMEIRLENFPAVEPHSICTALILAGLGLWFWCLQVFSTGKYEGFEEIECPFRRETHFQANFAEEMRFDWYAQGNQQLECFGSDVAHRCLWNYGTLKSMKMELINVRQNQIFQQTFLFLELRSRESGSKRWLNPHENTGSD